MVTLKVVTKDDYPFLYSLLQEKTAAQNISHKEMPTYEEHVAFNDAIPYAEDYIILSDEESVGRIYFTRAREVGIHILSTAQGKGIGKTALRDLMTKVGSPVYANISPLNTKSQVFFKGEGFDLVQLTYKWGA